MFVVSHFGAVAKNENLDRDEKRSYCYWMAGGLACGFLGGFAISIGVGMALAKALSDENSVSGGVEAGEGASKLLAFFFVAALALKLPQWFGISNYRENRTEGEPEGKTGVISSKRMMTASLFWNSLREATEGGIFTAIIVVLSNGLHDLGPSVAVGVASAFVAFVVMALGSKYISAKGFAITGVVIMSALSVGLITGASRSFEETYAVQHNDETSPIIYDDPGKVGSVLAVFEFIGVSDHLTVLVLCFWILSAVFLVALQYWHNYLGYPLLPSCKSLRGVKSTKTDPEAEGEEGVVRQSEVEMSLGKVQEV